MIISNRFRLQLHKLVSDVQKIMKRTSRVSWKVIFIWLLSLCTVVSIFLIVNISNAALTNCEPYDKHLDKLSKILCNRSIKITHKNILDIPTLYLITPTYSRPAQKADLTRLSHTLMHIPKLHWIIIEDADLPSSMVSELLKRSGIEFSHLNVQTPKKFQIKSEQPTWLKPKGVWQRNLGLDWLRNSQEILLPGVVYFADDDNTYDLQLFDEIRWIKRVSVWPVGLVGGLKWEGPKIKDGKIVGWQTVWKPERPFPIDMAGFSVNLKLILDSPEAIFSENRQRGYVESSLLEKLITPSQLEPLSQRNVLVWHTRTEKPKLYTDEDIRKMKFNPNDIESDIEV
ncbi:Galactosylgalactosylxylosylprotein 3-beta-glucuronosyltransferase 2 [Chamberlinius hualienensis]